MTEMIQIDDRSFDKNGFRALQDAWARRAAIGREAGLRYAVCLPDTADWLALFFAIREAGASVLPIHAATPYQAARRIAVRAGCHRLFFGDEVEILPDAPPAGGELLQMSSGTTGEPKCISRSWDDIERETDAYVGFFREPEAMTPVVACPTTHSYGLICGVLVALKRSQTPLVVNVSNPKNLLKRLRETERPLLYSSPAVLHTAALLSRPDEKIHAVMTSGTVLPGPWFEAIRARSERMFQQYGCSEAGCVAINTELRAPDEMGRPLPHLSLTAGESAGAPSEIVVTGPRGEIRTRDLGWVKRDGTLIFTARLDDTINVSGLNVYPGEVEDVAMSAPGVSDAVAFRLADAFAGERVGLLVSGGALDADAVRDWCRERLAAHQLPVRIIRAPQVPRQANGKISRREVASLVASGAFDRVMEAAQ